MDLPKPPDEPELKNIIDKLGNFVARNGPEFEQMTKQKQKDNPKFSFLFGGENYAYYQYRVTTEQAIQKQQQQKLAQQQQVVVAPAAAVPQTPWQGSVQPQNDQAIQLREQLEQQRKASQDQIKQSEQNLADHYKNLIQQQQVQIDESITKAREDNFLALSAECDITVEELDRMSTSIVESCTKDAISNGKNWIFAHNISPVHSRLLAEYMHRRIVGCTDLRFDTRLHLIYLMNDVLHHCLRKNADDLRKALENIVIPVFCVSYQAAEEEKQRKLLKLLDLWNKNKYFQDNILEELRDPAKALQNYQAHLLSQHPDIVQSVSAEVNQKYSSLQKQHQEFVSHLNSQITSLESSLLAHEQSLAAAAAAAAVANVVPPPPAVSTATVQPSYPPPPPPQTAVDVLQPPTSGTAPQYHAPQPGFGAPALGFPSATPMIQGMPPSAPAVPQQFDYAHGQNAAPFVQDYGHGQHPPVSSGPPPGPSSFQLPDFSKPPPGFPPLPGGGGMGMGPLPGLPPLGPPPTEADLMPSVPYFDLPAGLMAPLVKLEDSDYKPLDPKDMRLPPPQPPSDRLLAAVEAFYSQPSHERPRDGEGWEKLGLYEFFRAKQKAKKMKEQMRRDHSSQSSSSSSSSSRSRSSSSRSRSRSASRSRSRSRTPKRRRSRSRSLSMSPPGFRKRKASSHSSSRSRSRSKSRTPPRRRRSRERSQTPPSFGNEAFYQSNMDSRLGFDNKGHQLLAKMGWGGGGLGAKEQGRVDPVQAAEARDNVDKFKGLGLSMSDPFEQFRKNKAQGFITRMRARDAGTTSTPPKKSS